MDNDESSDTFFQEGYGIGPFQMMNEIGKGQFGNVYKGIEKKTNEPRAIKILDLDIENLEDEETDEGIKQIKNELKGMEICSEGNKNE